MLLISYINARGFDVKLIKSNQGEKNMSGKEFVIWNINKRQTILKAEIAELSAEKAKLSGEVLDIDKIIFKLEMELLELNEILANINVNREN